MGEKADIIAYSTDNRPVLVAEVKNRRGTDTLWATQMRRNLLAHSLLPRSDFFLLALPDYFYLWKNSSELEAKPDYKIKTQQILDRYVKLTSFSLDDISESGLELLTTSWLRDLAKSNLSRKAKNTRLSWLLDSGLYEAIKDGAIEAAA